MFLFNTEKKKEADRIYRASFANRWCVFDDKNRADNYSLPRRSAP